MRSLETDMVNLFFLIDLVNEVAEAVQLEANKRCLFTMHRKITRMRKATIDYTVDFMSNLDSENANLIRQMRKDQMAIDSFDLMSFFMEMTEGERDQVRRLMKAIQTNKRVTFEIEGE